MVLVFYAEALLLKNIREISIFYFFFYLKIRILKREIL